DAGAGELRIGIIIDVEPGIHGGVAIAVKSLLKALGELDGPEKYVLIVNTVRQSEWLSPLAANQETALRPQRKQNLARRGVRRASRDAMKLMGLAEDTGWPDVPLSDGYV